ncbi:MAG TPA: tail fiber domain-containing protein [Panacibacter sp.]|nr:tail fiber domain-containing protein [Panacibacter sp.]
MKQKKFLLCIIVLYCTVTHAQIDWHIDGNGGTTDSNFIGTTDAKPLRFKVNNEKAGYLEYDYTKANTAFGYQSINSNSGNYNDAFGYKTLFANTTGGYNTAVGHVALYNNKTGNFNTSVGLSSMFNSNTGSYNTAVGGQALFYNSKGSYNTALGMNSLFNDTAGSWNVASGVNALNNNRSGNNNSAFGANTMLYSTSGNNNTAIGWYALDRNTKGSYNTAVGDSASYNNVSGNYNTALGKNATASSTAYSNTTAIGYNAIAGGNNSVRIGNAFVSSIGGQVGWTIFSDERVKSNIKENVPGLAFIKMLRPVTYHYNIARENELLGIKNDDTKEAANSNVGKMNFTGLIAQEVDKAAEKIGYDFSGIDKTGNIMGLRYSDFVVPIIKSVQELSSENDWLKQNNASLQQQIDDLKILVQSIAKNNASASGADNSITSGGSLEQNAPNPFNSSTSIRYTLPEKFTTAQIIITDNKGAKLKQLVLNTAGKGLVNVDTRQFAAGTYHYTLYVEGKMINSRQMILVK